MNEEEVHRAPSPRWIKLGGYTRVYQTYFLYWIVLTFRIHLHIESLIYWSLECCRFSISAACETAMTQNSEFLSRPRKTGGRGPQANGPTARSCWGTGSPFSSIMAGSVAKDYLEPVIVTVLPRQWKGIFLWELSEAPDVVRHFLIRIGTYSHRI